MQNNSGKRLFIQAFPEDHNSVTTCKKARKVLGKSQNLPNLGKIFDPKKYRVK